MVWYCSNRERTNKKKKQKKIRFIMIDLKYLCIINAIFVVLIEECE